MERVEHDLGAEQWIALRAAWGGCAYCGASDRPLQRDCVLAISHGGRYTLDNVVPACGSCNASKCNDEVTGWLRRRRLDERAFLLRQLDIRIELGTAVRPETRRRFGCPRTTGVTTGEGVFDRRHVGGRDPSDNRSVRQEPTRPVSGVGERCG